MRLEQIRCGAVADQFVMSDGVVAEAWDQVSMRLTRLLTGMTAVTTAAKAAHQLLSSFQILIVVMFFR